MSARTKQPKAPKRAKRETAEVAYVRWFDSSITQGVTCSPEDACGLMENESFGVVIREDKETVTLALDRCLGTGGLRCTLCIPWANIRGVQRFRAVRS